MALHHMWKKLLSVMQKILSIATNLTRLQHLKVKKQYDGYITVFSKYYKHCIVVLFFVEHCNHKDLVGHFYEFMSSLQLSTAWLLSIGMDGPSVNPACLKQLQLELATKAYSFISNGSCPLHIANNAFNCSHCWLF